MVSAKSVYTIALAACEALDAFPANAAWREKEERRRRKME
jgi:hypothetical protein